VPDTEVAAVLRNWAQETNTALGSNGIYCFGSLVNHDGMLFTRFSDIDLVVIMPDDLYGGLARAEWILGLQGYANQLERRLLTLFGRRDAGTPVCSTVALTTLEVLRDVHKGHSRPFFSANYFRSLLVEREDSPLDGAGSHTPPPPPVDRALAYVQKVRNSYLAVAANGAMMMTDWRDDHRLLPKDMARAAAGLAAGTNCRNKGEEFDVRLGTSAIANWLFAHRDITAFGQLHDWLAGRRDNFRAQDDPSRMTPWQSLLLAEVIFDMAKDRLEGESQACAA
jgi:hypothetical protein